MVNRTSLFHIYYNMESKYIKANIQKQNYNTVIKLVIFKICGQI